MEERLQRQRFERKYFVTERQAIQIRDLVKSYLVPDEFSANRADYSYPVHSLYLDSEALMTYWATVHCETKRFKLRVRYYDDDPTSPLFFEIKHRDNECVRKQRGAVHRWAGGLLVAGRLPAPEHLFGGQPHHFAALQYFRHLALQLEAQPMVHVAYLREAWVNATGNSLRVTVDREVRGEVRRDASFKTQMTRPVHPFGERRVLELKFTDRFPDWLRDLVQHFDLLQTGAPKYCGSIAEDGDARVTRRGPAAGRARLAEITQYC